MANTGEFEFDLRSIGTRKLTPAFVRECADNNLVTSGPGRDRKFMPTSRELDELLLMTQYAVNRGQFIDFGYWPNDMIMSVAKRAGDLYGEGAIGHPFSTPYLILHSWDDPKLPFHGLVEHNEKSTACYLVNPFTEEGKLSWDFEAVELEGMKINAIEVLGVTDRVLLWAEESKVGGYTATSIPFLARFPDFHHRDDFKQMTANRSGDDIWHAACGNVLDPVMTALMLLNTRGVLQKTIVAPAKLNKRRVERGKQPIPSYREVDSASYVTVVMDRINRGPRKEPTGTHASPAMHVRQGHWREYKPGERTFIRDTLVNASEGVREAWKAGRSHYAYKDSGV